MVDGDKGAGRVRRSTFIILSKACTILSCDGKNLDYPFTGFALFFHLDFKALKISYLRTSLGAMPNSCEKVLEK